MPLEEVKVLRDPAFKVMTGENVHPDEVGIFRQMEQARKEWIANGMPQFWIERMARNFWEFVTYGIMEETHFKLIQTYPTLARFLLIRSHSIGQLAYVDDRSCNWFSTPGAHLKSSCNPENTVPPVHYYRDTK